jgi:hypothetical protein
LHYHPLRAVFDTCVCITESFYHFKAFQSFRFTLLRSVGSSSITQIVRQLVEVRACSTGHYRLCTHFGDELVRIIIRQVLVFFRQSIDDIEVLIFGQQVAM